MASYLGDPVAQRLAAVGREFGHGMALDLSRITAALDRLGRPHDHLPPVIHVAGTNGKGSTCAFLRAIVEAAGLRAHVFTSPHLIHTRERVRLAGSLVADDAFIDAIDAVAATDAGTTFFETVTAAAMLLFARTPADYVILEVGMGGLHDATNVIANPAVSVITPVDFDHQQFLGDSLAAIAGQKAGILKRGRPAVIGRQDPAALSAILDAAHTLDAPATVWGRDFDAFAAPAGMAVQTGARLIELPAPALLGPHQIDNAGLAVCAALTLEDARIGEAALAAGVAGAQWPGRLQPLTRASLGARARSAGVSLFVDGAHNPHGARALAASLAWQDGRAPAPTALVCGLLANKDVEGVLTALRAAAPRLHAVPVEGARACVAPLELVERASAAGFIAHAHEALDEALDAAFADVGFGGRVVICGSLHLAGAALALAGGVD